MPVEYDEDLDKKTPVLFIAVIIMISILIFLFVRPEKFSGPEATRSDTLMVDTTHFPNKIL